MKKVLALVLALVMTLGMATAAFAWSAGDGITLIIPGDSAPVNYEVGDTLAAEAKIPFDYLVRNNLTWLDLNVAEMVLDEDGVHYVESIDVFLRCKDAGCGIMLLDDVQTAKIYGDVTLTKGSTYAKVQAVYTGTVTKTTATKPDVPEYLELQLERWDGTAMVETDATWFYACEFASGDVVAAGGEAISLSDPGVEEIGSTADDEYVDGSGTHKNEKVYQVITNMEIEQTVTDEAVTLQIAPIDPFIATDKVVAGNFYFANRIANKVHQSGTFYFAFTLTNRYVANNDISRSIGKWLVLTPDAYVVTTEQFAEANGVVSFVNAMQGVDYNPANPTNLNQTFKWDITTNGQAGINFAHNFIVDAAVQNAYKDANFVAVNFMSKATLANAATFSINVASGSVDWDMDMYKGLGSAAWETIKSRLDLDSDKKMVYLYTFDGTTLKYVSEIDGLAAGAAATFEVAAGSTLGSYYLSDTKLDITATPDDGKDNAQTGANDMVSVAVALAVVSLAAAGAVCFKKASK